MLLVLLPWPSKVYFKMGSKIKKIAFLLPSLKFGGAERVALNLAMALKAEGIQIDFLLMSLEGEFLAEAERHFNVLNLQCNKTYKLPGRLRVYLAANKPDALISSFWKLNLCACLARLFYPSTKLILWEHSPPSKSSNSPTWLYAITRQPLLSVEHKSGCSLHGGIQGHRWNHAGVAQKARCDF